jgi:hypothetical protein
MAAIAAGAALAGMLATAPARADVVGQLQCNIAGGVGEIVTATRAVQCTFQTAGAPAQYYNGTFSRLGLDVGYQGGGRLTYTVVALGEPVPGALQGNYVGSGAGISLGTGVGVDALVGGSNGTISLQPLATTLSTGRNINAGFGALRLQFAGLAEAPIPVRHRRRHHHLHRD